MCLQTDGTVDPHADRRLGTVEEVDRLVGIGAGVVGDLRGKYGPGTGWVTMADPEGNEFCV